MSDTEKNFTDEEALRFHTRGKPGKLEINPTKPMATQRDLSLAYSPGVAVPVQAIADNPDSSYDYTSRGNMVAVMDVPRDQTGAYGIVTPGKTDGQKVDIAGLVEKPMPADAPSTTAVVGRYIISPSVFDTLGLQEQGAGGEIQLTDALAKQIGTAPFTGLHFSGERFDCGSKVGFLQANIAFGLDNPDMADALQEWLRDHIE